MRRPFGLSDVTALKKWIEARASCETSKITIGRKMALVQLLAPRRGPCPTPEARLRAAVNSLARAEDPLPPRFRSLRDPPPAPPTAAELPSRPATSCDACRGHGADAFAHIAPGFCFHCGEDHVGAGEERRECPALPRSLTWKSRAASRMGPYAYAWGWHDRHDFEARLYRVQGGWWVEVYTLSYGLPADHRASLRRSDRLHERRYLLQHAGHVTGTQVVWSPVHGTTAPPAAVTAHVVAQLTVCDHDAG